MATMVVVFKILFLILIAHSFFAKQSSSVAHLTESLSEQSTISKSNLGILKDASTSQNQNLQNRRAALNYGQDLRNTRQKTKVIDLEEYSKILLRKRRQTSPLPADVETAALVEDLSTSPSITNSSDAERADSFGSPANEPEERSASTGSEVDKQLEGATSSSSSQQPTSVAPPVNYAELCYLSNGGSSITLTVNEATQVGSIIGTVEVNGDPSLESGNVDLSDETFALAQRQSLGDQGGADQPTTTGHPAQQQQQVASGKQRRVLYRRSSSVELPIANDLSRQERSGRHPRDPSTHPPPLQAASQMLGLISDYQSSASGHSASFYSLVASTASPVVNPNQPQTPQTPPVKLEPSTRNLILVRQLDKESAEGEQSLVINVRCRPRVASQSTTTTTTTSGSSRNNSPDQAGKRTSGAPASNQLDSTTIPVRIIITDANDHAPEFVGPQPYVVNISETTPIGAVVSRDIIAQDRDSAGPFSTLHYRVLEDGTAHSTLLQFANPLEPTLLVAGQLDYESLPSFTITIVAQDEGEPEPLSGRAQVQVNIIDFDDQNPKFLDDKYTLVMDETQQNLVGQNLQVLPRNLYAEDGDRGIGATIVYSFDQVGGFQHSQSALDGTSTDPAPASSFSAANILSDNEPNIEHYLNLNPKSGEIRLIRQWPSKWMGSAMTLVVRATQVDNKDRYTLTTLTITRPNYNPLAQTGRTGAQLPALGRDESVHQSSGEQAPAGGRPASHGIEFAPDRLQIQVAENVAINENIARVRARYLGPASKENNNVPSDQYSAGQDSQAVDLIGQDSGSGLLPFKLQGNKTRRTRLAEMQQTASKRPINYQILDDQTDQFGINGLGEIFLKRQLDYEQRQEYKFRVLAIYLKYSDICQVQVQVLNVNDNKPKFTQPQYTFHLTESRLRSKLIGSVLAHDADLNDTIHYKLSGDHAHLFEINQHGQISLRDNIRQLNMTSCQLTARATDSLAPPIHSDQARVNLNVAAQLVGRSINFEHLHQQLHQDQEAKLFNSRSLIETRASDTNHIGSDYGSSFATANNRQQVNLREQQQPANSNQRSSVATVMSSLQHMVRSVNFFDMPFSSALLLSALLAFLICLLLIVVISMSVHLYRRRSKIRHRQHLAAAAHLRHAQMTATLHQPNESRPRYLANSGGLSSTNNNGNTFGSGSSASPNSSPTNSTAAGNSPTNFLSAGQSQSPGQPSPVAPTSQHRQQSISFALGTSANAANLLSPAIVDGTRFKTQQAAKQTKQAASELPVKRAAHNKANATSHRPASAQAIRSAACSRQSQVSRSSAISHSPELAKQQLAIGTISGHLQSGPALSSLLSLNEARPPAGRAGSQLIGEISLISTLSSQRSKRSYRSNTTDDSSVMHCGHYSVNASQSPQQQQLASNCFTAERDPALSRRDRRSGGQQSSSRQQSIEAAIKSLVRDGDESPKLGSVDSAKQQRRKPSDTTSSVPTSANSQHYAQPSNELTVLTESKPGIKAYRKLARPEAESGPKVGLSRADTNPDSAIASDSSPSSATAKQQQQHLQRQYEGLMAMIRDPDLRGSGASQLGGSLNPAGLGKGALSPVPPSAIKWPQGAVPNRVKKLTWDDEMSLNNEDCFVAADMHPQLGNNCPMSPLANNHQYPVRAMDNGEDQYAEQHFLFSNTCSPALLSADYTSFPQATSGETCATDAHLSHQQPASYRLEAEQSSMLGQNNCFDYTIVQSSQFHVDAFASMERPGDSIINQPQAPTLPQSLSAQHHHHLLKQQQQQINADKQRLAGNYLYSNSFGGAQQVTQPARPDLTLMTAAVL